MHFFYELYTELRASWWPVHDAKDTLWCQNEAREKSSQCSNELMKQVLVMVLTNVNL